MAINRIHLSQMIKVAIKKLDLDGQLQRHADAIGIAGGVEELRKIANTEGELHLMDLGMLGLYFFNIILD